MSNTVNGVKKISLRFVTLKVSRSLVKTVMMYFVSVLVVLCLTTVSELSSCDVVSCKPGGGHVWSGDKN